MFRKPQLPRQASERDIELWFEAADLREETKPVRPLDNEQRRKYLRSKNPVRYYRMRSDARWAQRLFIKLGIDPEEVRWLF